jgi:superfamily II DNA or RNA helicase
MADDLRPRQANAISDIVLAYQSGKVAPILVSPTGSGKTFTAIEMIRRALAKGGRIWFLSHLKEINHDTARRLGEAGLPFSYVMAGHSYDRRQPVQVVSVQTAVRRIERLERPTLIIVDEAHLAVAATYQDIFEWAHAGPKFYKAGGAKLMHLTATPVRLDGRGMGEVADCIIETCSTQDLIDEGMLAPIKYFAPQPPDLTGVHTTAGEFNQGDLAAVMDKPKITGSAVAEWMKVARHRPTIAFCVSIEHAHHVAKQFCLAGVRAVAVSGESDPDERDAALADLKAGRIDVVCNCALFVAGVDCPSVSCVILLCPTQSLTKFLQSIGRGLRMHPGKDCCIVLDHAGNIGRHGNPAEARTWSLSGSGKKRGTSNQEMPIKTCPSCFRMVMAAATDCACGYHFEPKPRMIEQVDGDLQEIDLAGNDKAELARARIESVMERAAKDKAAAIAALVRLAKQRGYRRPEAWAEMTWRGKVQSSIRKAELADG